MRKSKTQTEYRRRIQLALSYIDRHIDRNIPLEDIADACHFSPYHFHRIFHALVGETVNDYVSRKRMEKAAYRLIGKPDLSITDVALMGGFSSSANFSKAFKLYFGVSPSMLRDPHNSNDSKIGKIYSKYGKAFNPRDLYSQFVTGSKAFDPNKLEELLMQVKVEEKQERPIAYLTAPKGYELDSIYETWDAIASWARSRGLEAGQAQRFAICHDNPAVTPEAKCRYDASVVIPADTQVTAPCRKSALPAGKYAVAYYRDTAEKINSFMTELCSQWFPESGYEPDDFPPVFHYLNDARQDGYVEMEVHIKVKQLSVRQVENEQAPVFP